MLTTIRVLSRFLAVVVLLLLQVSDYSVLSQNFNPIQQLRWSSDGTQLAVGYYDGSIEVLDVATRQITRSFDAGDFVTFAWSPYPNINRLAAVNIYGEAWIWDVSTGNALVTIQAQEPTAGIAWSPDGTQVAIGHQYSTGLDERGTIKIWDATTGQLLSTFDTVFSTVSVYEWSPDGTRLTSLGGRGVLVWEVASGTVVAGLIKVNTCVETDVECAVPYIAGGAWSADGTKLLTAGALEIQIWSSTTYETQVTFAEYGTIRGLTWSPDGSRFAITSDNSMKIWDVSAGTMIASYVTSTTDPLYSVAWSPDGNQIAFPGENNQLQIIPAPETSGPTSTPIGTNTPTETPTATLTNTPTLTPTATHTPAPASPISSFTVLGQEGIWLEQDSTVVSGDIGANVASSGPFLAEGSEVTVGIGVEFLNPSSDVFGDSVYVRQGGQVYDVHFNQLQGQGQILGQQFTPLTLPVVLAFPTVPSFTAGTQNVNVLQNGSVTLNAGSYGTLQSSQGATITFSGGIYTFQEWNLGMNNNVVFAAPTEIRIAGRLRVEQGSYVGPATGTSLDAADIIFYVTGQNGSTGNLGATPKAAIFGINNTLVANVYAPNGTLWIRQGSTARGAFLARWVDIGVGVAVRLESAF